MNRWFSLFFLLLSLSLSADVRNETTFYHAKQVDAKSLYVSVIEALAERKGLQENKGSSFWEVALESIAKATISSDEKREWSMLLRMKDQPLIQKFVTIASNQGLVEFLKEIKKRGFTFDQAGFQSMTAKKWKESIVKVVENRNNLQKQERERFNKTFLLAHNNWAMQLGVGKIIDTPTGFSVIEVNQESAFNSLATLIANSEEMGEGRAHFPSQVIYGSIAVQAKVASFMKYATAAASHSFVLRAYYYGLKGVHTPKEVDEIIDKSLSETFLAYPKDNFQNHLVEEGLAYIDDFYSKPENMDEKLDMGAWLQAHEPVGIL